MSIITQEVRLAFPADEDGLMDLLRARQKEDWAAAPDENRMRQVVQRGINQHEALIGVIHGPKRIEASIGIYAQSLWFSRETHVADLWNFVHPDHRTTRTGQDSHAKKLIRFAKWAQAKLARPMYMQVPSSEHTEGKVRLYERELGKAAGMIFVVSCGSQAVVLK